ncbi:MAG: hypothetical protein OIF40_11910, partial [Mangrovicoccus sp.]|nr:hypothetical protein [Mangrovicoccus sp.]
FRQAGRDFLEGFDVRDDSFEDWLRDMRQQHPVEHLAAPLPKAKSDSPIRVQAFPNSYGSSIERITGHVIADQMARSLEEFLSAQRFADLPRDTGLRDADLEVRCDIVEDAGRGVVFVRIEHGQNGQVLFSGHRSVTGGLEQVLSSETIGGLVHSAASKVLHGLVETLAADRPEAAALSLTSQGIKQLSRLDVDGLQQADQLFQNAFETDQKGVFLAWRAFTRMAQLVESADVDQQARLEQVRQLTSDALQTAPGNGLNVALVALSRIMLEDDLAMPAELARKAINWNSENIFARQTLAIAHSAVGDPEQAYKLSTSCRRADPEDDFGHLWDLYHALVCISSGRFDEAREMALRSANAAGHFIAPKRQLVALCAHSGDVELARRFLDELTQAEQGFSLDRYLNDADYPVHTLRKAGLIAPHLRGDLDS